jgi:hypothetical protein
MCALLDDPSQVEETERHPAPPYGLESPVIKYLLKEWSVDPEKLRYLTFWLVCTAQQDVAPPGFPPGLQLVALAPEIKVSFSGMPNRFTIATYCLLILVTFIYSKHSILSLHRREAAWLRADCGCHTSVIHVDKLGRLPVPGSAYPYATSWTEAASLQ